MIPVFDTFWRYRHLVGQLIRREVLERYRGSVFGLIWSFLHPLLMLLVYMFVFGVVFKMKWGVGHTDDYQFGVVIFAGLIVHALFAECLVRSPTLILSKPQFVKKVVFPLEILPMVIVGTALFHMSVGIVILLVFNTFAHATVHWTILLIPVILLPLLFLSLGLSWFLASLGVFIRDIGHIVGILATVLLFLCPIFYPLTAVPEGARGLMYLNPLTLIVIEMKNIVIFGRAPDWFGLFVYYGISILAMGFGYYWFNRTRRAFADVI